MNRVAQNSYQVVQYGGSYGSSIGSYNEAGDANSMFAYYSPAGLNMPGRRLVPYPPHGGVGMSPSTGSFAPLPLGTSPSQFTPPTAYGSPAAGRGSCHGSPLGKMAAGSHYNRRKSLGYDSLSWHDGGFDSHQLHSSGARWKQHAAPQHLYETLPDPGDWDPNYSEELLLQDDGSELASELSKGLNIASPEVGHGRFNHVASTSTSTSVPFQR